MARKADSKTQDQVVHKTHGSAVNPLYMTYSGSLRKVPISQCAHEKICAIALELGHLPEEVASAWIEGMLELHNINETNFCEN